MIFHPEWSAFSALAGLIVQGEMTIVTMLSATDSRIVP
jgi:hypothetical protein